MTAIIINRATVEQALEALESVLCDPEGKCCIDGSDADRAVVDKALAAFRAALAQQAEPVEQTCTWQQDGDSDSGVYGTSCGHYFQIEDGTPDDNKMAWCCYCGKKLAQELITENEDE